MDEATWLVARARGPRGDAVGTKGLGPWRPLGTIQFWEFLERNLMCYLNQQVTCILEIYIYIVFEKNIFSSAYETNFQKFVCWFVVIFSLVWCNRFIKSYISKCSQFCVEYDKK